MASLLNTETDWYQVLVGDLKELAITSIVQIKHAIGKRVLQDILKFQKPEYGSKRVESLAADVKISRADLYRCIQFAEQYPELSHACENLPWRQIVHKLLPQQKGDKPTPPLPEGVYDVLYADPPWQYDNAGLGGAAAGHYRTMSLDQLAELDVPGLAAKDAVMFLWATNPFLGDALGLLSTWGFEYKTNICWVKEGRPTYGKLGFYVRGQHELLLIGSRGSKLPEGELPNSVVSAAKGKHSAKPVVFYDIIEGMYPSGRYVELFARGRHSKSWQVWGDEA